MRRFCSSPPDHRGAFSSTVLITYPSLFAFGLIYLLARCQ
jgi:hypothetical protein